MIDIHSHILPSIDDGAYDLDQAIAMARQAVRCGVHTAIATPHHRNGRFINERHYVNDMVSELQAQLDHRDIPLRLIPGQEIRVYSRLCEDLDTGLSAALGASRYVLLEFPSDRIPSGIQDLLLELQLMGKVAIIAHPERNREIVDNPVKLKELVQMGALSQVTAHSLLGDFGKTITTLSLNLCKNGLAHFIASDAHNTTNRSFVLDRAYEVLQDKVGLEVADAFQQHAVCVVQDLAIKSIEPEWAESKWYQFWKPKINK